MGRQVVGRPGLHQRDMRRCEAGGEYTAWLPFSRVTQAKGCGLEFPEARGQRTQLPRQTASKVLPDLAHPACSVPSPEATNLPPTSRPPPPAPLSSRRCWAYPAWRCCSSQHPRCRTSGRGACGWRARWACCRTSDCLSLRSVPALGPLHLFLEGKDAAAEGPGVPATRHTALTN